jgi:hypothetical protein
MLRTAFLVGAIAASLLLPMTTLLACGCGHAGGGGPRGELCTPAAGECTLAEVGSTSEVVPASALRAGDAAFGTAAGALTESARAGSWLLAAMSGFAVRSRGCGPPRKIDRQDRLRRRRWVEKRARMIQRKS